MPPSTSGHRSGSQYRATAERRRAEGREGPNGARVRTALKSERREIPKSGTAEGEGRRGVDLPTKSR
jgi:hypothetical protein